MVDTLRHSLATTLLVALATAGATAQVRPDQFTETASLDDVCFYTQEGGLPRKVCIGTLRSDLSPTVKALSYVPSFSGNPDRTTFGVDPNGVIHYIDYLGRALVIERARGALYVRQSQTVNGTSILVTVPMPPNPSDLVVLRSGVELTSGIDFEIAGNTISLVVPASQERFTIKSPL